MIIIVVIVEIIGMNKDAHIIIKIIEVKEIIPIIITIRKKEMIIKILKYQIMVMECIIIITIIIKGEEVIINMEIIIIIQI